jgi:AcrR family transcriptional regulator
LTVTQAHSTRAQPTDGWARRRAREARRIERAALELFAVDGPDNVTVEQIARAAGISPRTFFRYFPTRDDVMRALPQRQVVELCEQVAKRPPTESVLQAFIAGVRNSDTAASEEVLNRLWGQAAQHWGVIASHPQPAAGMVTAYGEVIAGRLGVRSDDIRVQVMATSIASVIWLAFLRWFASDGSTVLARVVEECFAVLSDLGRRSDPVGRRRQGGPRVADRR